MDFWSRHGGMFSLRNPPMDYLVDHRLFSLDLVHLARVSSTHGLCSRYAVLLQIISLPFHAAIVITVTSLKTKYYLGVPQVLITVLGMSLAISIAVNVHLYGNEKAL